MLRSALLVLLASLLTAATLPGAEPELTPLLDGNTLSGWTVKDCDAVVEDGAILLKSGNGVVHTNRRYRDFVLQLDWLALRNEKYDSGIYFRCELPEGKRPWPDRYQVNLRQGMEGNLVGNKQATSTGLIKPGEWNSFRLSVVGTKVALLINGQPAWKADGIEAPEGFICLQAEVPGGGQFRFRNIGIADLSAN